MKPNCMRCSSCWVLVRSRTLYKPEPISSLQTHSDTTMDISTHENNVDNSRNVLETIPAQPELRRKRKHAQQSTDHATQEVPAASRLSDRSRKAQKKTHKALDDEFEEVTTAASSSSTDAPAPPSMPTLPATAAINAHQHLVETRDRDGNPVMMFQYDGRRFPVNAHLLVPPRPYTRRKKLDPNPMVSTQARVIQPPPVPPALPSAGPQVIKWSLDQPPAPIPNSYAFLDQSHPIPMGGPAYHPSPSIISANASTARTTRDVGVATASDVISVRTTRDVGVEAAALPPLRTTRSVGVEIRPDTPLAQITHNVGISAPSFPQLTPSSIPSDAMASPLAQFDTPTPPSLDVDYSPLPGQPSLHPDLQRKKDFVTGVVGIELSALAPTVRWSTGVDTALPFIYDPTKPRNNKLYKDEEAVGRFAGYPPSTDCPFIAHLDERGYAIHHELVQDTLSHLARGSTVVVKKRETPPAQGFFEYIEEAELCHSTMYHVHDMEKRHEDVEHPHVQATLGQFLKNTTDADCIQCILSATFGQNHCPKLIEKVDHGYHYGVANVLDAIGQGRIPEDTYRTRNWALIHHGGVHTMEHHDLEGQGTWMEAKVGQKHWGIVQPAGYTEARSRAVLNGLLEQFVRGVDEGDTWQLEWERRGGKAYTIDCQPGDLVIMPPNAFHLVYTPVSSVAIGGHFLSYSTLHLTEVARAFDHHRAREVTNENHLSVFVTLCGMVIGLFREPKTKLYTKCLKALCRMVIHYKDYIADSGQGSLTKSIHQYMKNPICSLAAITAKVIVEGMGWDIGSEYLFSGSEGWMDPGEEVDYARFSAVLDHFHGTYLRKPEAVAKPATFDDIIQHIWVAPSTHAPAAPSDCENRAEKRRRR
ncbi:hypothetical protein LshimejAT787_2200510 [Lyophyllum shimeji]|uniref:JmjC domain-containing protein n=1 Tax=Lyophyllum shimeji TaxID=47721 RepID=A0A9P3Q0H9_LYOSH|nr:hypothetical protein LshimejAT787_2200510 [Lyophyllum shimeji]